jgi:glycosyltransferase involved in cell wall biosynthesis
MLEYLAERYQRKKLRVIENGIVVKRIQDAARSDPDLPIDGSVRNVGIVARFVPVKRHDLFVEAARIVLASRDDVRFHIIGDGPLRNQIDDSIREANIEDRVLLQGFSSNAPAMLSRLDALVICSDHEGLPMVVLEAAALGLPIVSVPLPSIDAVLRSGSPGLMTDDRSPESIAATITRCLNTSTGRGTLPDISWVFSASYMAERYERTYRELQDH